MAGDAAIHIGTGAGILYLLIKHEILPRFKGGNGNAFTAAQREIIDAVVTKAVHSIFLERNEDIRRIFREELDRGSR